MFVTNTLNNDYGKEYNNKVTQMIYSAAEIQESDSTEEKRAKLTLFAEKFVVDKHGTMEFSILTAYLCANGYYKPSRYYPETTTATTFFESKNEYITITSKNGTFPNTKLPKWFVDAIGENGSLTIQKDDGSQFVAPSFEEYYQKVLEDFEHGVNTAEGLKVNSILMKLTAQKQVINFKNSLRKNSAYNYKKFKYLLDYIIEEWKKHNIE